MSEARVIQVGHANNCQGIAAEIEEAVVDADLVELQQIAPEVRQVLFCLRIGRDEVLSKIRAFAFGAGKSFAIDLGVGS